MLREAHGADERAGLLGRYGLLLDPGPHVPEAGALQADLGVVDRREVIGRRHPAQVGGEPLVPLRRLDRAHPFRHVPLATALRFEDAAGPKRREQPREQAGVVEDPVEGCVREDRVDGLFQLELQEVAHEQLDPGVIADRRPRVLDHRGRPIDPDHSAPGQALEQLPGHAAAAAPCVEHELVAAEVETGDDAPGPLLLGIGQAIVGGRLPVDRVAHRRLVTGPRSALPAASKASIAASSWSVNPMSSSPWSSRCLVSSSISKRTTPPA
jgi:hypothetical protein